MKLEDKIMNARPSLIGFACKILKNEADAEDAVQEATIKALLKYHQFDASKSKFSTWLHEIVKNECLHFLMKKKKLPIDGADNELIINNITEEEEQEEYYDDIEFTSEFHQRVIERIKQDECLARYDLTGLFIDYYSGAKGYYNKKIKPTFKTLSFKDMSFLTDTKEKTIRTMFRRVIRKIKAEMNSPSKEFENNQE